jgi:glycerol-3-phosphate acyltransferase PlsX
MAKIGYLLARKAFGNFGKRVDYAEYGGAPLLGVNGTGIICHGRSNSKAIKNAIKVAAKMIRGRVNGHIIQLLSESDPVQIKEVQNKSDVDQKSGVIE